jgi:hypothetical protein
MNGLMLPPGRPDAPAKASTTQLVKQIQRGGYFELPWQSASYAEGNCMRSPAHPSLSGTKK